MQRGAAWGTATRWGGHALAWEAVGQGSPARSRLHACRLHAQRLAARPRTGRNNPKRCTYGLYAEQISGTHFTAPRTANQRSWLYRVRPSVTHTPFHPVNFPNETLTADFAAGAVTPNQLRWRPFPIPPEPVDWVRGLFTVCGAGRCGAP
jgi:homogentisate 1,2-dioxygenase